MGLVERSLFPEPPSPAIIADFRRHVRETGCPESWPSISTTHPPTDGEVTMLAQEININLKLRPDGSMAPCPICLPDKPKWKHDGALIWCEVTEAVYCIGPNCSRGELRRKINVARNLHAQTQKDQREITRLAEISQRGPAFLKWIASNRALASTVSTRHRQFATAVPKLRNLIARQLTQGLPAGVAGNEDPGALNRGKAFLTGRWNIERDLDKAERALQALVRDIGGDAYAWAEALSRSSRSTRLREAQDARRLIQSTYDRLAAGADFLCPATFGILGALSRHPASLAEFDLSRTGASATITHREEFWRGSIGSNAPTALPIEEQ